MAESLDRIAQRLLALPSRARADLASRLVASLDEGEDEECEALWLAEAQKRLEDVRSGKALPRSAEEVVRSVRSRLK